MVAQKLFRQNQLKSSEHLINQIRLKHFLLLIARFLKEIDGCLIQQFLEGTIGVLSIPNSLHVRGRRKIESVTYAQRFEKI